MILGAALIAPGTLKRAALYPLTAMLVGGLFILFRGFSYTYGALLFSALILIIYCWYWLDWFKQKQGAIQQQMSATRNVAWAIGHLVLIWGLTYNSAMLTGYQIYHIPSPSMMPVLIPGDYVLVDLWWYQNNPVIKNDVVVFKHPYKQYHYIKRVKIMPSEPFLGKKLSANTYAMLGDNRDRSIDSRVFGSVDSIQFKGRACSIVFSFNQNKLNSSRILVGID